MNFWKMSKLITLVSLVASTGAIGSFSTPHYLGISRDHSEFRMYLNGGEFLGQIGSLQTITVAVHQLRKGHSLRALEGCVYRFDNKNGLRDRIECAQSTPGPLSGVEYARDLKKPENSVRALAYLVCVRRCGRQVPQRLSLEDAEEDNA